MEESGEQQKRESHLHGVYLLSDEITFNGAKTLLFDLILTLLFISPKVSFPVLWRVSAFNRFLDLLSHFLKRVNSITISPFTNRDAEGQKVIESTFPKALTHLISVQGLETRISKVWSTN